LIHIPSILILNVKCILSLSLLHVHVSSVQHVNSFSLLSCDFWTGLDWTADQRLIIFKAQCYNRRFSCLEDMYTHVLDKEYLSVIQSLDLAQTCWWNTNSNNLGFLFESPCNDNFIHQRNIFLHVQIVVA